MSAAGTSFGPRVSLKLPERRKISPQRFVSTSPSSSSGSTTAHLASKVTRASASDYKGVESSHTKNVVVLGGSYGGMHAATVLAQKLPPSHRVILIERNSHFNHLYVFPRFSVLQGHEHKAFIPYSSIFGSAPKRRERNLSPNDRNRRKTKRSNIKAGSNNILEMGGSGKDDPDGLNSLGSADGLTPQAESSSSPASSHGHSLRASRLQDEEDYDDRRSASTSSNGRSSASQETDPLFDQRTASSDTTSSSLWQSSLSETSAAAQACQDAGNKAIEAALVEDGQARARTEEALGRPSIEVTELRDAIEDRLDLTGEKTSTDHQDQEQDQEQIAQGFEDAAPHVVLQATVTGITDTHVIVTPAATSPEGLSDKAKGKLWSIDSLSIPYTHLIYAMGSHLPDPLRTTARSKPQGISWMRHTQQQIKEAKRIILVGGGALGVEYATDIKSVYPDKDITLIHSRQRLLPNFDERIHTIVKARLEELGVKLVLGERLALTEGCPKGSTTALPPEEEDLPGTRTIRKPSDAHHTGLKRVRTTGGKEFVCDLLMLCTGQQPNSSLMASLSPTSVDPHTRLVRVHPTLQVALPPPEEATPGPFDARPPCGDCDCFLDKKAAGGDLDTRQQQHLEQHGVGDESPSKSGRLPNVYAIGDVADAFGSLNAGYQAWGMADIAAENIVRDIGVSADVADARAEPSLAGPAPDVKIEQPEMVHFNPAPNMLKLSLGLGKMVFQGGPIPHHSVGEDGQQVEALRPEISVKEDPEDLGVEGVWTFMANAPVEDLYL